MYVSIGLLGLKFDKERKEKKIKEKRLSYMYLLFCFRVGIDNGFCELFILFEGWYG